MKGLLPVVGALLLAAKPPTAKLGLTGWSSEPELVALGTLGVSEAQIEEIWISMKDVRLHEASTCRKGSQRVQVRGPITGELVSGRAVGLPDSAVVEAGRYCGLELTLRRAKGTTAGVPPKLRGASILVEGRRGDGVRFLVRSRLETTPWLGALPAQGFEVADGTARLFLAVDAARWMAGLDLAAAEVTDDGSTRVIRIDDKSNPELLAVFERNVAAGLSLFRDADGDGLLGADERAPEDVLASGGPAR